MSTILCTILGCNVDVYDAGDGSYWAISCFNVDGDGSGGNLENDPDFQDTTSLRDKDGNSLNARTVPWIVLPPQPMFAVGPMVLGCRAWVTNTVTGKWEPAVVADEGPSHKLGEGSICLAKRMGIDPIRSLAATRTLFMNGDGGLVNLRLLTA
jgi:hypothetical protein